MNHTEKTSTCGNYKIYFDGEGYRYRLLSKPTPNLRHMFPGDEPCHFDMISKTFVQDPCRYYGHLIIDLKADKLPAYQVIYLIEFCTLVNIRDFEIGGLGMNRLWFPLNDYWGLGSLRQGELRFRWN